MQPERLAIAASVVALECVRLTKMIGSLRTRAHLSNGEDEQCHRHLAGWPYLTKQKKTTDPLPGHI